MSDRRILCVGMCVFDIVHLCTEFPTEDTDKRCLDGYWQRGGNASNSCTVLSKLGAKCEFLGMISSSPAFQFLYEDFKQKNINIKRCPKTEMNPPLSSIILAKDKGSRTILHSNPGFPILTCEHFRQVDLKKYSWIHFEGRNLEETQQMIDLIIEHNKKKNARRIKISVELEKPKKELFELGKSADIVFISKDLSQFMGWTTAKNAVCLSQKMIFNLGLKKDNTSHGPSVICPWGSECSDLMDSVEKKYYSLKAVKVENVVDSLGAGDTFVAAVIYAVNNLNKILSDAVDYANQVAAFKIQHRGYDCVENFKI